MLWKKVRSSAMLAFPPLPKLCPQGESGQSEVEADVSPMQPVDHVLTQLEVEQMPRSWAGQLFEGGGEEKEPVVEGEGGLTLPPSTSADQLCQPCRRGKVEPLSTGLDHQAKSLPIRAKTKMGLCRLSKLLHTRRSRLQPHLQLVPRQKNEKDGRPATAP